MEKRNSPQYFMVCMAAVFAMIAAPISAQQEKPAVAQQAKPAATQQVKPVTAPAQQIKPAAVPAQKAKPGAVEQPVMALGDKRDAIKKKMLIGFDLGYFMPLQDLGDMVNGQVSGRVFFQYQDIAWWFGLGLDMGFTQLEDKKYDGTINLLNIVAHPFLTFPLGKGFDLQVLLGIGMSVAMADIKENSADGVTAYSGTSVDPMIDAGFNVMYTFLTRYAVGIEVKYYHIFEDPAYTFNGIEGSVFFAVKF